MKKFLRILFFAVNLLFAILLLLSTLAGVIPPSKCSWISLLSYVYMPFLLLNVVCALVWLFFKRWEFLLSIIVIVVRFNMIPLFIQVGGTSTPPVSETRSRADEFRVMTYNVHQFGGKDYDIEAMSENASKFMDIVSNEDPDVICLQELMQIRDYSVSDTLEAMGYKYHYSQHTDKNNHPYGVAIFSKNRIGYVGNLDNDGRKIYADIHKDEFKVRVVCVHMSSYHLNSTDHVGLSELQNREVRASKTHNLLAKVKDNVIRHEQEWNSDLKEMIEEAKSDMVFVGDFNDTPASYLSRQVRKHLKDSFVEEGSGFGITYNGPFPTFRIDYIYHSKELKTISYHRISSDISDHSGIVAVFTK